VTVNDATGDGTATIANDDYQSTNGSLTFNPAGPLTQTIQVFVNGDTNDEPDSTFYVNLSAAVNATVVTSQGVGTIQDDSTPISVDDVTQYATNNGTTSFGFTVSLAHASTLPISVDYATSDGTATLAAGDYQAQAGTLTFAPGETSETITILVNGDTSSNSNETFFVNLANPVNGVLAQGGQQGVGTILANNTCGTSYYVNVSSIVGDVYCTAPGSNSNNGLTPATPVASLSELLSMYTFHPGDTIYVDTGNYDLYRNVVPGPGLSGVRIIGSGPQEVAPDLDGSAVLADNPVAFWRLGDAGGATAADATGNGYNGTYVGDVTALSAAPTNDGAALLTGAGSYVSVP
jgi:Calx-beta domain